MPRILIAFFRHIFSYASSESTPSEIEIFLKFRTRVRSFLKNVTESAIAADRHQPQAAEKNNRLKTAMPGFSILIPPFSHFNDYSFFKGIQI